MIVEMGNATPTSPTIDHSEPCVTSWNDNGSGCTHVEEGRPNGREALLEVLTSPVTHLPDHEAFVSVVTAWQNEGNGKPTWVYSEDCPDLALMVSEAYGCPVGRPDDIEDTHYTHAGPPGVGPTTEG